ncbi:hypothetical protein V8F33_009419 [Rhypophila sp. PSN 637]
MYCNKKIHVPGTWGFQGQNTRRDSLNMKHFFSPQTASSGKSVLFLNPRTMAFSFAQFLGGIPIVKTSPKIHPSFPIRRCLLVGFLIRGKVLHIQQISRLPAKIENPKQENMGFSDSSMLVVHFSIGTHFRHFFLSLSFGGRNFESINCRQSDSIHPTWLEWFVFFPLPSMLGLPNCSGGKDPACWRTVVQKASLCPWAVGRRQA